MTFREQWNDERLRYHDDTQGTIFFFFSEKEYKVVIRCSANKSAVARVHRMYLVVETRAFSFDLYLLYPSRALFDTL